MRELRDRGKVGFGDGDDEIKRLLDSTAVSNNGIDIGKSLVGYLTSNSRFFTLVGGILFFFGIHNFLQEYIMQLPGFTVGVFLGYLEVLGVTICSSIERKVDGETERRAPWSAYAGLCFCLLVSSATSNIALNYINYPTKVVFRSCKLIPTICISIFFNKKRVETYEVFFCVLITLGMVVFAIADFNVSPNFHPMGVILVSVSVLADAFLPNLQERVFDGGSSRGEVTYYTNISCLSAMTVLFMYTGDIKKHCCMLIIVLMLSWL